MIHANCSRLNPTAWYCPIIQCLAVERSDGRYYSCTNDCHATNPLTLQLILTIETGTVWSVWFRERCACFQPIISSTNTALCKALQSNCSEPSCRPRKHDQRHPRGRMQTLSPQQPGLISKEGLLLYTIACIYSQKHRKFSNYQSHIYTSTNSKIT